MASFRTRRRVTTGVVGTLIVVVILFVSGGIVSSFRTIAGIVVEPFSWTINAVATPIGHAFAGALNYSEVVGQNRQLRSELGQARMAANQQQALERQVTELTSVANVPFVGTIPMVTTSITRNSPTNLSATFDIAKGSADGILPGMPVVANGGLVGSVASTTRHGATVRLITDSISVVGCTFGSGNANIVVSGHGVNAQLAASQISLSNTLQPGTVFTTDGLSGGLFPPGIPVATVSKVSLAPGSTDYDLSFAPSADLRHLYYVDVLLWEPAT